MGINETVIFLFPVYNFQELKIKNIPDKNY